MVEPADRINILQYNLRKSRTLTQELFQKEGIRDIDIIAVQEPWRRQDVVTTVQPDKQAFHLAYPDSIDARVCLYINHRIGLSTWNTTSRHGDIITLHLRTETQGIIHLHNLYNPNPREGSLAEEVEEIFRQDPHDQHIILGDFNLHHPSWGGQEAGQDEEAEDLIYEMESRGME